MLTNAQQIASDWNAAKIALDAAKAREAELRLQVIEAWSTFAHDETGTETIDVGLGATLKIVHATDYKLDNANDYEAVDAALDQIEKLENGSLLAERLCRRKLELSVTEYKKLPAQAKTIIDKVLTTKPASKSVSLKVST